MLFLRAQRAPASPWRPAFPAVCSPAMDASWGCSQSFHSLLGSSPSQAEGHLLLQTPLFCSLLSHQKTAGLKTSRTHCMTQSTCVWGRHSPTRWVTPSLGCSLWVLTSWLSSQKSAKPRLTHEEQVLSVFYIRSLTGCGQYGSTIYYIKGL